ncbi:hypothetical protein DL98DRAFT_128243 [Cadophora sp. DSE1049]|nr:hypothetical protein DL98DRAFT_128243 [Cadophora sp. DSE1049]
MSANAAAPVNLPVLPLLAGPLEPDLRAGIAAATGNRDMINTLLAMPTLQPLLPRGGGAKDPAFDKIWKVEGALLYLKGHLRNGPPGLPPCIHCYPLNTGPYAGCVMVPNSPWGCANRMYSKEGTNCQYSPRNQGVISWKMIERNPGPRSAPLLAESQNIAPALQADYLQWRAREVARPGFLNTTTAQDFAREAIQRVATRTQQTNHLLQAISPGPRTNIELLEGLPQQCNGVTEARVIASEVGGVDQKYTTAAEVPHRVVDRLIRERTESLILVKKDPGYIYMIEVDQKMVIRELMDMLDRRFTQAVVTAMGANYSIICVATAQQSATTLLLRLPNTLPDFDFHLGTGPWIDFNRAQRSNPAFP